MKVLRFALFVIFTFTLFVIPAHAKGGADFGFVALVTQADPAIPLRWQALQAYDRLLPDLIAAQSSGAILDFEPEFGAGILKIAYAAGARATMPLRMQGADNIQAAAAQVPYETKITGQVAGLVIAPSFTPVLFSSCFSASGLGNSSRVIGSLRDTSGRVVANFDANAGSTGTLSGCFDWAGPYTDILPGYKLTFSVYDSSALLLGTFSLPAPNLNFTTFKKTTGVVGGGAPKNKLFSVTLIHGIEDATHTRIITNKTGTTAATGKWRVVFGPQKINGGDAIYLYVTMNSAFTFERDFYPPVINCVLGSNTCTLYGFPFHAAAMAITHGGIVHTFTGMFNSTGGFSAALVNTAGAPIFLVAGDKISGTGNPVYSLPNLTATPNFTTDVVSGKAPASKYFGVLVRDVYNNAWYSVWAHSDSAGNYSADFTSLISLTPATTLTLYVNYTDPATGNNTQKPISFGP